MNLIYPGSFDPVTLGHIDIASRGAKLATRLIVAVLDNINKKSFLTIEERISLLRHEFAHIPNIEVASFSGLLAEYAQKNNATAILRGIRGASDFESEARYAANNWVLSSHADSDGSFRGIETIFVTANPYISYISSTIVREAAFHIYSNNLCDKALLNMVTPNVQAKLRKQYGNSTHQL